MPDEKKPTRRYHTPTIFAGSCQSPPIATQQFKQRTESMSLQPRKILVTSALPYANGPIHLGQMLEYIQTDIWVRFQRMRGDQCTYVCADGAHGTAIKLKDEQMRITPEQLIEEV